MDLIELFNLSRTGVAQILHIRGQEVLGYGSGFFLNDKLVTNFHVAAPALSPTNGDDLIGLRFHGDRPNQPTVSLKCSVFATRVRGSSEEQGYDYLIADLPEVLPKVFHQFKFSSDDGPSVGQFVAFQGYPFGQASIAGHAGHVSSIYSSGVATMMQLDANVNSGNSGGPLLDVRSGHVLGMISRKQTGLSAMFDQLIESFDSNDEILNGIQGGISISGINPMAALALTQRQLGLVAQEIKRSANVGIGFAIKATALRDEAALK